MTKIMKKIVVAAVIATAVQTSFAHSYDLVDNEIGDSYLVTIGGYWLCYPISVPLSVTADNGEVVSDMYSVTCKIVYKDFGIQYPPSEDDWDQVQSTRKLLNEWLEAYIGIECEGTDFDAICDNFRGFVHKLQEGFPIYVDVRASQMDIEQRINVEVVTVEVLAEEALNKLLHQRLKEKDRK